VRIISNAIVLTCDRFNTCGRYHIAVRDGRIAGLGKRLDDLTALFPDATFIPADGKIIIPGLINAHLHGESLLHEVHTQGLHLQTWVNDPILLEAQRRLLEPAARDDLRVLYRFVSMALVHNGITTVGEFTPPVDEEGFGILLQSMTAAGVKVVPALRNWDSIAAFRAMSGSRPRAFVSIGKESQYNVYSFRSLTEVADEEQLPLLAHVAETREDVEIVRKNFRKAPLTVLKEYGALRHDTLMLHGNYVSDQEGEVLRDTPAPFVLCPRSTAYKQTGYPSLRNLLGRDLCVALGTDWGSCDMLSALGFLADLPLMVSGVTLPAPARLFHMATANAAAALGVAGEVGSIEAGKKADLTFLSPRDSGILLSGREQDPDHIAGLIMHHHNTMAITDVMIDGEFFLEDSSLRTIEEEEAMRDMAGLVERYYPVERRPETRSEAASARVLSLIGLNDEESPTEGFEEGFSVIGPAHASQQPVQPGKDVSPPEKEEEPRKKIIRQPELSRNVRRVFGDDDEV
jgi:5-methylthioadenosine/S-adenosylhomocysteine deaminase